LASRKLYKPLFRRQKQGEHISLDLVNDKNETPVFLALAHGLSPHAEELIISGASIAVPTTQPAIFAAAKTCDMTVMRRILDLGTCDVDSIIAALKIFDTNYKGDLSTTFTALAGSMIRYVKNKFTPSDEDISSKLVEFAKNCKYRYPCELVLTSRLLDRASPCDGERFTLLQAASAYNVTWKLAELNVANLPNAERRSALLVALRHGSLRAAKHILRLNTNGEWDFDTIVPHSMDMAFDHPLDLLTCALCSFSDQFLHKVLDLGAAELVASATPRYNNEDMNQEASSAVKHGSMVKLFDASVEATTASLELLSLISTTAKLEGYYESINGLSSSDFDPNEERVQRFVISRWLYLKRYWRRVLQGLGIEINDHWAAIVSSDDKFEPWELLDVRKLVDYLTDHIDVMVKDGLRAAIEQGKAFRLYERNEIDESDQDTSTSDKSSVRSLLTRSLFSTRSPSPTKAEHDPSNVSSLRHRVRHRSKSV
jgi:hypothetical protein